MWINRRLVAMLEKKFIAKISLHNEKNNFPGRKAFCVAFAASHRTLKCMNLNLNRLSSHVVQWMFVRLCLSRANIMSHNDLLFCLFHSTCVTTTNSRRQTDEYWVMLRVCDIISTHSWSENMRSFNCILIATVVRFRFSPLLLYTLFRFAQFRFVFGCWIFCWLNCIHCVARHKCVCLQHK